MRLQPADYSGGVDWWPFARIIVTAAVLAASAHAFLGWQVQPKQFLSFPGQILGVMSVLALISFALADLFLLIFLIPLYVLGVLNDCFYDLGRWFGRKTLGLRSDYALALAGLCGEILLFGGLALVIRHFLAVV